MSDDVNAVIAEVENKTSDSTGSRYAGAIRVFAKWCETEGQDPFAATPRTVENYLQYQADEGGQGDGGYAYQTLTVHRAALTQFYKRAKRLAEDKVVPDPRRESPRDALEWENPAQAVSMGDINVETTDTKRNDVFANRPDDDGATLSPDEVEDLADSVPAPKVRNELLVRLMYQCMLRRGEAARIRLENVDRDAREVFIPAEDSKTGEAHTAYYNASLDFLMNQWVDADRESSLHSDSPYLFVSQKSERLADYTVSNIVRTAADNAGHQETLYTDAKGRDISRVTGHALRRAGATRRWNNGADIYTVKELLNHDSVETTKEYLRLKDDDLAEKARQSW